MPASSMCSSNILIEWILCKVNSEGMPLRLAMAGMRPVIQSLQWMISGRTWGMMLLMTSR